MSAKRIIDVARCAGDANLGRTLLRLARLAEAAHRFDVAFAGRPGLGEHSREDSGRTAGVDAPAALGSRCTDAAGLQRQAPRPSSVCTEVNR